MTNRRQNADWARTPVASVGDGPTGWLAAAHHFDPVDIVAHRMV